MRISRTNCSIYYSSYLIHHISSRRCMIDSLQLTLSILQCKNGHPLCSACKSKVGNQCPTCRQELGDIRCLVLEKVAEKFKHSCKYQSSGCPEVLPYSIKSKHEEQCSFRPFNCPYPRCSVVGNISFLVAHLKDSHNGRTSNGCSYSERYIITYETGFQDRTWKPVVSFFYCLVTFFILLIVCALKNYEVMTYCCLIE